MWTRPGGGGICQISVLQHKHYLLNEMVYEFGGGQKSPKNCLNGLWTTPINN